MKNTFLIVVISLLLFSCSSMQNDRKPSSVGSLNGTLIGIAKYVERIRVFDKKRPNELATWKYKMRNKYMATRIYFDEVEEAPGHYNVILLEYVNLLKMAPKYIASNKLPLISRKIGFLNQITSRITMYRAIPTADSKIFDLQKITVNKDQLVIGNAQNPSQLKLAANLNVDAPIEGATITASKEGEPVEVYFPAKKDKVNYGFQYNLANFTYDKIKLDSTWRKEFLAGPYLGAYGDKRDEILSLKKEQSGNFASFKLNKDRAHLSAKKREKQLTNKKSAYLVGNYEVIELSNGIFIFKVVGEGAKGVEHVENKIGLFIDIFDASKALNQDVVELVLIDSNTPDDFLMYYEHPENGEGE